MLDDNHLSIKVYQKQNNSRISKLLGDTLRNLVGSHFLALQLAKRDISAQYRQSYLGMLWLFITPLATAGVWIFLNASGTISPYRYRDTVSCVRLFWDFDLVYNY